MIKILKPKSGKNERLLSNKKIGIIGLGKIGKKSINYFLLIKFFYNDEADTTIQI